MEKLTEYVGLESKEYKGKLSVLKSRMSLEKQKTRLDILRNSRKKESLSTRAFETRTATGREHFAC